MNIPDWLRDLSVLLSPVFALLGAWLANGWSKGREQEAHQRQLERDRAAHEDARQERRREQKTKAYSDALRAFTRANLAASQPGQAHFYAVGEDVVAAYDGVLLHGSDDAKASAEAALREAVALVKLLERSAPLEELVSASELLGAAKMRFSEAATAELATF